MCLSLINYYTFSSHPYIFFNEDTVSITFVGFMVKQNGDLVDPVLKTVLESAIMEPLLYKGLKQNKVNFDEDYCGWNKDKMIAKIASVWGFGFLRDPDVTYVLTTDNLIKMLAIQMRFRCVEHWLLIAVYLTIMSWRVTQMRHPSGDYG